MLTYQCKYCLAVGDGRSFSKPETDLCNTCLFETETNALDAKIRDLIAPYLRRYGQSEVGDLARAVRDTLEEEGWK